MSSDQWVYVDDNNRQQGPVSRAELLDLWAAGEIAPRTPIQQVGSTDWQRMPAVFGAELPAQRKRKRRPADDDRPRSSAGSFSVLVLALAFGFAFIIIVCLVAIGNIGRGASATFQSIAASLTAPRPQVGGMRVTRDNFARVRLGMGRAELEALLGPNPAEQEVPGGVKLTWTEGVRTITVTLDPKTERVAALNGEDEFKTFED